MNGRRKPSSLPMISRASMPAVRKPRRRSCRGTGWVVPLSGARLHDRVLVVAGGRLASGRGRYHRGQADRTVWAAEHRAVHCGRPGQGVGRSLKGFSLFGALSACRDCLLGFGGHGLPRVSHSILPVSRSSGRRSMPTPPRPARRCRRRSCVSTASCGRGKSACRCWRCSGPWNLTAPAIPRRCSASLA